MIVRTPGPLVRSFQAGPRPPSRPRSERNMALIRAGRMPEPRLGRSKSSTELSPSQLEWLRRELLDWFGPNT
jgi:hypothetical protein